MLIDQVRICNMALGNIGQPNIASLNQPGPVARACKQFYDVARVEALSSAPWGFNTVWKPGVAVAITPMLGYTYAHAYPADALTIYYLNYDPKNEDPPDFKITDRPDGISGRLILSNMAAPELVYGRDKEDVTQFDFLFTSAFAGLLSSKLAMPLTKSQRTQDKWEQRWMAMRDGAWAKALNQGSQKEDADRLGFYHEARNG